MNKLALLFVAFSISSGFCTSPVDLREEIDVIAIDERKQFLRQTIAARIEQIDWVNAIGDEIYNACDYDVPAPDYLYQISQASVFPNTSPLPVSIEWGINAKDSMALLLTFFAPEDDMQEYTHLWPAELFQKADDYAAAIRPLLLEYRVKCKDSHDLTAFEELYRNLLVVSFDLPLAELQTMNFEQMKLLIDELQENIMTVLAAEYEEAWSKLFSCDPDSEEFKLLTTEISLQIYPNFLMGDNFKINVLKGLRAEFLLTGLFYDAYYQHLTDLANGDVEPSDELEERLMPFLTANKDKFNFYLPGRN